MFRCQRWPGARVPNHARVLLDVMVYMFNPVKVTVTSLVNSGRIEPESLYLRNQEPTSGKPPSPPPCCEALPQTTGPRCSPSSAALRLPSAMASLSSAPSSGLNALTVLTALSSSATDFMPMIATDRPGIPSA